MGRFVPRDVELLQTYLQRLNQFRSSVKVHDYVVYVRSANSDINHTEVNQLFYRRVITKMGQNWEMRTLQDVEELKIELFRKLNFQPFLARVHVRPSSIAFIMYFPCWIEISPRITAMLSFFQLQEVAKVYLDDDCLVDWTKKEKVSVTGHSN